MATCRHPHCDKQTPRKFCTPHYFALPEDIRDRLKRARSPEEKGHLMVEAEEWFESRMIGKHEIVQCPGNDCFVDVVWMPTRYGKKVTVDADQVQADDTVYEPTRHARHVETCPNQGRYERR